jgi:hypothetical protein
MGTLALEEGKIAKVRYFCVKIIYRIIVKHKNLKVIFQL